MLNSQLPTNIQDTALHGNLTLLFCRKKKQIFYYRWGLSISNTGPCLKSSFYMDVIYCYKNAGYKTVWNCLKSSLENQDAKKQDHFKLFNYDSLNWKKQTNKQTIINKRHMWGVQNSIEIGCPFKDKKEVWERRRLSLCVTTASATAQKPLHSQCQRTFTNASSLSGNQTIHLSLSLSFISAIIYTHPSLSFIPLSD